MAERQLYNTESDGEDCDTSIFLHEQKLGKNDIESVQEVSYKVLSVDNVVKIMNEEIQDLQAMLELPANVTRALLVNFAYSTEKVFEHYFDNREKTFKTLGIIVPQKKKLRNSTEENCMVCYSDLTETADGLECGHLYCTDCWGHYIEAKINDEGMAESITCIDPDCKVLVDDDLVMKVLVNPQMRNRYQKLITDAFVISNALLNWCPGIGCTNALQIESKTAPGAICTCGTSTCTACHKAYHDPISCDLFKRWLAVDAEECASMVWINENAKPCPRCNSPIEKNGGCNHMTCKKFGCKGEFCWVCLQPWSSSHACNQYVPVASPTGVVRDIELFLARYEHYKARYEAHKASWTLERNLIAKVDKILGGITDPKVSLDFVFLKTGVQVLLSCRLTLQVTFVFAFFANRSNQIEIFEDNQRYLEQATEMLSGYFEKDLSEDKLHQMRDAIYEKCVYCDMLRSKLLDHLEEGFEKNIWKFSDH